MSVHPQLIDQALANRPGPQRLVIGFSGGLDSTVLLHLAHQWQLQQSRVTLLALHINHQLQPDAAQWQQHCQQLCQQLGIPFAVEVVAIDQDQASQEQAARSARYAAFRLHAGAEDRLLLAHHRDDQVETLLQRLLRGSGPLGLGAMAVASELDGMTLLRPLLDTDRAALERYARAHGLHWIDDPSNRDSRFERNFLRNEILPQLRQRWPSLNQTLARSARLNRDTAGLLDNLAQLDGASVFVQQPPAPLPVPMLTALAPSRALNLLRYWLRQHGVSPPSEAQLKRVLAEMLPALADGQPELCWGGHSLRRYHDAVFYVPVLADPEREPLLLDSSNPDSVRLTVGSMCSNQGQGTAFSRSALQQDRLTLRFRHGGEQARPAGRRTRQLRQWLQDYQVAPWWRDHWPILYCGEAIAGLPGLFACTGFEPQDQGPDALWLDWIAPFSTPASR